MSGALTPQVPYHPVGAAPRTRTPVMDKFDFGFMVLVFMIASDAFNFLGLHSLLWLSAYGYALLRIVVLLDDVSRTAWRNRVLLLYPLLCLVSVLWSDLVVETAVFSVQLTFSMLIAVFIGMRFDLRQIFTAAAAVLLIAVFASLLNLGSAITPAYDHRGNFEGIFLSKNALGHRLVMFFIIGTFALVLIPRVPAWMRLLCLAGLAASGAMIAISGSATAMLMAASAVLLGMTLWFVLSLRGGWALVLAVTSVPAALMIYAVIGFDFKPVSGTLELLGRSPTLTGRTVLWAFAAENFPDRPFLGYGASGFWGHPAKQYEIAILQQFYGEGVHSFHNLWAELLIMLGPLGLLAHTLIIGTAMRRCFVAARDGKDIYAAWALTTIITMYIMALFGSQLYQQHAIPLMLIVAIAVSLDEPRQRTRHRPSTDGYLPAV